MTANRSGSREYKVFTVSTAKKTNNFQAYTFIAMLQLYLSDKIELSPVNKLIQFNQSSSQIQINRHSQ